MQHQRSLDGTSHLLVTDVEIAVVKRAANGAEACTKGARLAAPAFRVDVVSCTGAGDACHASFIAARLRGVDLRDALGYANAVAAIKVTQEHARSVPSHEEVLAFLKARGMEVGRSGRLAA